MKGNFNTINSFHSLVTWIMQEYIISWTKWCPIQNIQMMQKLPNELSWEKIDSNFWRPYANNEYECGFTCSCETQFLTLGELPDTILSLEYSSRIWKGIRGICPQRTLSNASRIPKNAAHTLSAHAAGWSPFPWPKPFTRWRANVWWNSKYICLNSFFFLALDTIWQAYHILPFHDIFWHL